MCFWFNNIKIILRTFIIIKQFEKFCIILSPQTVLTHLVLIAYISIFSEPTQDNDQ